MLMLLPLSAPLLEFKLFQEDTFSLAPEPHGIPVDENVLGRFPEATYVLFDETNVIFATRPKAPSRLGMAIRKGRKWDPGYRRWSGGFGPKLRRATLLRRCNRSPDQLANRQGRRGWLHNRRRRHVDAADRDTGEPCRGVVYSNPYGRSSSKHPRLRCPKGSS